MDRRNMILGTALASIFATARAVPQATDSSKLLNSLFDQFMKENLDLSPLFVTTLGLDTGARARQKSEIDDGSEAGIERQKALIASQLARLKTFDRASLSASDAVSYDVVMYGLRTTDAANKAFRYGPGGAGRPYVLSQLDGSYERLPSFLDNQHTIKTKADADAYIARLAGFATLLDQEVEVARHDLAMGVAAPEDADPIAGPASATAREIIAYRVARPSYQGKEYSRQLWAAGDPGGAGPDLPRGGTSDRRRDGDAEAGEP